MLVFLVAENAILILWLFFSELSISVFAIGTEETSMLKNKMLEGPIWIVYVLHAA